MKIITNQIVKSNSAVSARYLQGIKNVGNSTNRFSCSQQDTTTAKKIDLKNFSFISAVVGKTPQDKSFLKLHLRKQEPKSKEIEHTEPRDIPSAAPLTYTNGSSSPDAPKFNLLKFLSTKVATFTPSKPALKGAECGTTKKTATKTGAQVQFDKIENDLKDKMKMLKKGPQLAEILKKLP